MERAKIIGLGVVLGLGAFLGLSTTTQAWSGSVKSSDDTVKVAKDETHKGSLYAAGDSIVIDGTVEGTLYCAGADIHINGTVTGDVLCAGQTITIKGTVGQDVRLAGQTLIVDGQVGGSASMFGQDIRVSSGAKVAGDINGATQTTTIDGEVGGSVVTGMQTLLLNGKVAGNVDAGVDKLRLGDEATIGGNLSYSAPKELSIADGQVAGAVTYHEASKSESDASFFGKAMVMMGLMFVALAMIIVAIAPRFVNRSSELMARQPLNTALLGFAVVFGLPLLAAFLMLSVILLPLGILAMLLWFVVMILSGPFAAYRLGDVLMGSQLNVLVRMLAGAVLLLILFWLPFINILVFFVTLVIGSGMLVATFTHGYKRPNYTVARTKAASKSKE